MQNLDDDLKKRGGIPADYVEKALKYVREASLKEKQKEYEIPKLDIKTNPEISKDDVYTQMRLYGELQNDAINSMTVDIQKYIFDAVEGTVRTMYDYMESLMRDFMDDDDGINMKFCEFKSNMKNFIRDNFKIDLWKEELYD